MVGFMEKVRFEQKLGSNERSKSKNSGIPGRGGSQTNEI
jgi:hypothetical protein